MEKIKKKIKIVLIMISILLVTTSLTLGKYVYNSVWNYYLSTRGFYFESDLLDVNSKNNSLLKWDGSNIYFMLKNSLNNELISEYDISYKITCEVLGDEANYVDCMLNGTTSSEFNGVLSSNAGCINNISDEDVSNLNKAKCELNGYTWQQEITSTKNYFNFKLSDESKEIDELSVKITVDSIEPYTKKLVGIFNINKINVDESSVLTKYQSFSEYDELTIINTSSSEKCLSISFDTKNYLFDASSYPIVDEYTDSLNKINQIDIKINKKSSSIYNFYKINNEKEYSVNDFVIEEKEC